MLTPNMDPNLIETGVPGLRAIRVEKASREDCNGNSDGVVKVTFNQPVVGRQSVWFYYQDGREFWKNPCPPQELTTRWGLDITKPIRTKRKHLPVHVVGDNIVPEPGCEPEIHLKWQASDGAWHGPARFTKSGRPLGCHAFEFENVPEKVTRTLFVGERGGQFRGGVAERTQAKIEITYENGIAIDARLVNPNKEPIRV